MKKLIFLFILLFNLFTVFGQKFSISWGESLKLKKNTTDISIIGADKTGYYFIEKSLAPKMFSISGEGKDAYKLVKYNNSFEEEFEESYKSELKGLDLLSFQSLNDDIFLFATDYVKKEKAYKVFCSKIDKTNGKLLSTLSEVGSYAIESKKDDFTAKLTKMKDGKNFLLVSDLTAKDNTRLAVTLLDGALTQKSSTDVVLSFQPGFYMLQDVKLINNYIIVLGKVFEEVEWKKKRKKKIFKNFALSIYDITGKKLHDIPLDLNDKFTLEGKLLELDNKEVAITGFYSNDAKKQHLSGFFVSKIDITNGKLTLNSIKEITTNMLGQNFTEDSDTDDDDDAKNTKEGKAKAEKEGEVEEFSNLFTIKSIEVSPTDGSFIITSEITQNSSYTFSRFEQGFGNSGGRWVHTYVYDFKNRDILIVNTSKEGAIKWLNIVPKNQLETVRYNRSNYGAFIGGHDYYSYFVTSSGMPFHSSFKSTFVNDKYIILYNDNKSNSTIAQFGDKVKSISNYKRNGEMFALSFDISSGKATKAPISSCSEDDVITMPRHSFILDNQIIVPAWRQRLIGKSIFKIAKVTIK